jgi:hypothetical protein
MIIPTLSVFASQVVQLAPNNESDCYNFVENLRFGMGGDKDPIRSAEILKMQSVLAKEGFQIRQAQVGTFGVDTFLAVIGFQDKYKKDILIPAKLSKGNGYIGPLTRKKLNSLYGCQSKLSLGSDFEKVVLKIKGILIDKDGVSVTFCNLSPEDIPTFPVRIRLNGIIREFDILSALQKNTCYPARWPYETWGLSYDAEIMYTTVVLIDPFGYYKKSILFYPDIETISLPALQGMSLSVRSLVLKNNTIQATFCNMGTKDVTNFPVDVILNGVEKNFDIINAHKSGKCTSTNWNFDNWGIKYSAGTLYTAVIIINNDSNSSDKENFNEFNNAAAITGIL